MIVTAKMLKHIDQIETLDVKIFVIQTISFILTILLISHKLKIIIY